MRVDARGAAARIERRKGRGKQGAPAARRQPEKRPDVSAGDALLIVDRNLWEMQESRRSLSRSERR